ncbi:MAG: hypothetical protein A2117_00365 [Candidatus Wildermuthbacteria bacterium GWA2_46_15]|uniref:DUF3307 domain-containing protein n=1 Tax=Candidatus Wildermuthbacteria bacterium GWA2_46_15 TaxID=1802443 RepID=A0A1G2QQ99_9BACT|nr:MAG: hypothetical protein A2117_00365 [Candidatus Wildermuthbacteria bacterium GWA2_46_15]
MISVISGLFLLLLEQIIFGWLLRNRWSWGRTLLRALTTVGILTLVGIGVRIETSWVLLFVFVMRLAIDRLVTEEATDRFSKSYWMVMGANEMLHVLVSVLVLSAVTGEYRLVLILIALEVKHWLADWCLTTAEMAKGKATKLYGFWSCAHALVHLVLSISTLGLFGVPFPWVVGLPLIGDGLVHPLVDRIKGIVAGLVPDTKLPTNFFGRLAFGTDQMLHHMTYAVMAAIVMALV